MTLAITLWLVRSISVAFWLVEHAAQVGRARLRNASGASAWLVPAVVNWRAGDRVGPLVWGALIVAYAVAWALSVARA